MKTTLSFRLSHACYGAILTLTLAWPALTQSAPVTEQPTQPSHAHSAKGSAAILDERVKRFAKALNLTETQQSEVKKILEQRQHQLLVIRNNPSLSGSERIGQFQALQVQTVQRIRAILDSEQKQKYDPLAGRKVQQEGPPPDVEEWLNKSVKPQ
jgi:hypothetical protein